MKTILLASFIVLTLSLQSQCTQNVCENLPATITADIVAPPPGETFSFSWNIPVAFTGQGTDVVVISNVGSAPLTIPYSIDVVNTVTGCISTLSCEIVVNAAVPYTLNIPPYCAGTPPFDISAYVNPSNAILSGPAVSGNIYDPSIGGAVTATPPNNSSGCLIASSQTPSELQPPTILSFSITQ